VEKFHFAIKADAQFLSNPIDLWRRSPPVVIEQLHQKYITRLTEAKREYRRHSDFRVGLYGCNWVIAWDFCYSTVEKLMEINRHKLNYYQQGLKVLSVIS
jgi:hypothetical protein